MARDWTVSVSTRYHGWSRRAFPVAGTGTLSGGVCTPDIQCKVDGETCGILPTTVVQADCCDGLLCLDNICATPAPVCSLVGEACSMLQGALPACCDGLVCRMAYASHRHQPALPRANRVRRQQAPPFSNAAMDSFASMALARFQNRPAATKAIRAVSTRERRGLVATVSTAAKRDSAWSRVQPANRKARPAKPTETAVPAFAAPEPAAQSSGCIDDPNPNDRCADGQTCNEGICAGGSTGCTSDAECGTGTCCCDDGSCSADCCPLAPEVEPVTDLPNTGIGIGNNGASGWFGAAIVGAAAALLGGKKLRGEPTPTKPAK